MGAFSKYQSMATNLALSFEEVKEHPTMTICFNPTHDEFVYGQNFHFNFYEKLHDFYEDKASNSNTIQLGLNPTLGVKLTTLNSAYSGKCYKISPTKEIAVISGDWLIAIKFDEKIGKVPVGQIYITSEANSMGIGRAYWYEGIPYMVEIGENAGQEIKLVEYDFIYLKEKSNCNDSQTWYDCFAELADKLSFHNCPSKCFAHSIREGNQSLDYCKPKTSDWSCSNIKLRKLRKSVIEDKICPRSCHIREYEGKTKYYADLNRPHTIVFSYYFSAPYVVFKYDEYVLFDFLGLISSVGGTLGIFIGISILAVISSCFSYFVSLIEKCSFKNQ